MTSEKDKKREPKVCTQDYQRACEALLEFQEVKSVPYPEVAHTQGDLVKKNVKKITTFHS